MKRHRPTLCQSPNLDFNSRISVFSREESLSSSRSSSSCSVGNYTGATFGETDGLVDEKSLFVSLKRFKISTTPGELCLAKDVEQLTSQFQWRQPQQPNTTYSNMHNHTHAYHMLTSPQGHVCLERDPVDPLRLRISTVQWEFLLQVPRRYPHTPPVIYRVTRRMPLHAPAHNLHGEDGDVEIVVSNIPKSHNTTVNNNSNNSGRTTVVYQHWTPVSRLVDLLAWLSEFSAHLERRRTDIKSCRNNNRNTTPLPQATVQPQYYSVAATTSDMDMREDKSEATPPPPPPATGSKHGTYFHPKRFDMGFSRAQHQQPTIASNNNPYSEKMEDAWDGCCM